MIANQLVAKANMDQLYQENVRCLSRRLRNKLLKPRAVGTVIHLMQVLISPNP